jgi:hypothetical protein
MPIQQTADDMSAQIVLKQAELVALEVTRAAAIVDYAMGAAAMVMSSKTMAGTSELADSAKEILQVARNSAATVLQVAKKEAEVTLCLARDLANLKLEEASGIVAANSPFSPASGATGIHSTHQEALAA